MTTHPITRNSSIGLKPIVGALGCEVSGVDLANLDDATFAEIYRAFLDYSVLVFHDQELTQEQFAGFGKRFGKLEDEPFLPFKADVPGVFYVRGGPGGKQRAVAQLDWHTDHTYQKNPSLGAILYALNIPPAGGDTLFASNYRAYDALSPEMRQFVERLTAIHDVLHYGIVSHLLNPKSLEAPREDARRFRPSNTRWCAAKPAARCHLNKAWVTGIKGKRWKSLLLRLLNEHALTPVRAGYAAQEVAADRTTAACATAPTTTRKSG